ncbi:hypothetical protein D3C80_1648920 [compost metagenome]
MAAPTAPPGSFNPARFAIIPASAAPKAVANSCTVVMDAPAISLSASGATCKIRVNRCGQPKPMPNPTSVSAITIGVSANQWPPEGVGIKIPSANNPTSTNSGPLMIARRMPVLRQPELRISDSVHPAAMVAAM